MLSKDALSKQANKSFGKTNINTAVCLVRGNNESVFTSLLLYILQQFYNQLLQ